MRKYFAGIGLLCACLLFAAEARASQPSGGPGFARVGLDEAKALFEEGAVFIDARSAEQYTKSHVEGAVLISKEELDGDLLKIIYTNYELWEKCDCNGEFKKKDITKIDCVVYGSGPDDGNMEAVAGRLVEEGFRNVFIMQDGFDR